MLGEDEGARDEDGAEKGHDEEGEGEEKGADHGD